MKLSAEILDIIFGLLVSQWKTLIACSKVPALSQIVEKHLYYHTVVDIMGNTTDSDHVFKPDDLSNLASEKPHILNYIKILEIQFTSSRYQLPLNFADIFDKFAKTLLMFPVLECITLMTPDRYAAWYWSTRFQAALEDRLNLPTMREVHFVGGQGVPYSFLGNSENIEHLSRSESFPAEGPDEFCASTVPQLKSLTLSMRSISSPLLTWLKLHSKELRSLKCSLSSVEEMVELFGVCSGTLNKLYIDVADSEYYSLYTFKTGQSEMLSIPELSPFTPNNLERLIIHTEIYQPQNHDNGLTPKSYLSWLPAAVKTINLFSSLQHLVLDVNVEFFTFADLANFDFSPLEVLGASVSSILRIDLYIHTGRLPSALTLAYLLSSLENDEGLVRSIKEGKLVIHSEKTAL